MTRTVLITGGAGFIGSHCAALLLQHGWKVRALDNLDPQIHGRERTPPPYLDRRVELIVADIRSPRAVRRALIGTDAVIHLAARVGVGQSMYEIADYTDVNSRGTAVLLEAMVERAQRDPFMRLVVASSMSVYGEGLYRSADGAVVSDAVRNPRQLKHGIWDPSDEAGRPLEPLPTPESKPPSMGSVYALSKYDQERLCLVVGGAYGIPTVALRFFNVYGPHQALSNPYTGVLAIFAARLMNGRPPLIFEDGAQRRDFVHVDDVAEACRLALGCDAAVGSAFNIGSGRPVTIRQTARLLGEALGAAIEPEIPGECRLGDVRHCFPDIGQAQAVLGYRPRMRLEDGLVKLVGWLDGRVAIDRVGEAREALAARGLMAGGAAV
ncbi:MAG: NAD-dependent epimerase/dehydratase family protein [Alphaproteobacteria bacterium]|nr:NAD-dependent epimerase/dehydratase family protein [Alphaproteobacteria bacterium]